MSHGRILTPDEREKCLNWYALGMRRDAICKKLKVSAGSISETRKHDPDFKKEWEEIKAAQVREVEQRLVKAANGNEITIKETYQLIFDRSGEALTTNGYGHPELKLVKREKTINPPNVNAMMFFLRAHKPEVYAHAAQVAPNIGPLGRLAKTEDLQEKLREKLKELGIEPK